MKITVLVKPKAKKKTLELNENGEYIVGVISPARDGKANSEVIDTRARYLKLAKSRVQIVSGHKSKKKILEII